MSKELLLVFVYDCEMCKNEEDDPEEAIVYFYPTWVNREQRYALCSQLMGVTQFCNSAFSLPRIISLQSGKFSIKRLSRYYLCVGTDRNIPDIVLESRSKTLYKLIRLFHYDIEAIQQSIPDDSDYTLTDKLTELFHVYMPILQYATNIFGNIPKFKLPKNAGSLYIQAMYILQSLQGLPGVLGGVFLQQNKVIATQVSCQLTKQFVVTDPYRIKLPADKVSVQFQCPPGVELITVYVNKSELERLKEHFNEALSTEWKEGSEHLEERRRTQCEAEFISGTGVSKEEATEAKASVKQLATLNYARPTDFVLEPPPVNNKWASTDNLVDIHQKIPIRYYSFGLPKVDNMLKEAAAHCRYYNTLTDPSSPRFKPDGLPCSSSLFKDRFTVRPPPFQQYHQESRCEKMTLEEEPKKGNETERPKRNFTLPLNQESGGRSEWTGGVALTPLMAKLSMAVSEENVGMGTPLGTACKTPRSARPPRLIPIVDDSPQQDLPSDSGSGHPEPPHLVDSGYPEPPQHHPADTLSGHPEPPVPVPVDPGPGHPGSPQPHLVNSESGHPEPPWPHPANTLPEQPGPPQPHPADTLPEQPGPPQPHLADTAPKQYHPVDSGPPHPSDSDHKFKTRGSKHKEDIMPKRRRRTFSDYEREDLVQSAMYIFGQNNTVILLLLENKAAKDSALIHYLWEMCKKKVAKYEERLKQVVDKELCEPASDPSYSYLLVDPGWGPTDRAGAYRPNHIELLTELHHSLNINPHMTDITLRTDDTVSYGYQLVGRQVYYQESCSTVTGLPLPSDVMGTIPVKARQRLERDHDILIL